MLSLIFVFLAIFASVESQSLRCRYAVINGRYTCNLEIHNSGGFDRFTRIDGRHDFGKTARDVVDIIFVSGTTPIIPRIICETFNYLECFYFFSNVGLKELTENSFEFCFLLIRIWIHENPLSEIHPLTLQNNHWLREFDLNYCEVSSFPEELFRNTKFLDWFGNIGDVNVVDFPANIFENLTTLETFYMSGLQVWSPEWTRYQNNLYTLYIYWSHFEEIPRNAVKSFWLDDLNLSSNKIKKLDYFMFNDLQILRWLDISFSPVEAIDFNLVDRASSLISFNARNCTCIDRNMLMFQRNRPIHMAALELCFEEFDRRILSEFCIN